MSLFEWLGEGFNPGNIGTLDKEKPTFKKIPRYQVILKFLISVFFICYVLFLSFNRGQNFSGFTFTLFILIVYLLLGFFITPKPDYNNIGFLGGLIDHPFRFSDDINRFLFFLKLILLPARFASISIRDFYILIKNRNY